MARYESPIEFITNIKVVGIGGAGGNAVARMLKKGVKGVEFIAMNTDAQVLKRSIAPTKVQLGPDTTRGLGAGSNPLIGEKSAEESRKVITEHLKGGHLVFITCGMGGGTGTGGAPIVAEIAKELKALVVAVVTKPFNFEGVRRQQIAEYGLNKIRDYVDTLIVVVNDRVLQDSDERLSIVDAFKKVDEVLYNGVAGISEIITKPGLVNVDFSDVRNILSDGGVAHLSMGSGSGERAAYDAVEKAINSPLLDTSIKGAKRVLFNVRGGNMFSLVDVNTIGSRIREEAHNEALIIYGADMDRRLKNKIKVTIIASDIGTKENNYFNSKNLLLRPLDIEDIEVPTFVRDENNQTKTK